jgi:hypothetical protein
MSFVLTERVMRYSRTMGSARAILLVLACRANDNGECWPSLDRIAEDAGLAQRTVCRMLKIIHALGELRIERSNKAVRTRGGKQAVNRYWITLESPKGSDSVSPPSERLGSDSVSSRGLTACPKGSDGVSEESSLNHQYEPSIRETPPKLTGHTTDYEEVEIPEIRSYADVHAISDPIVAAMAVTGERGKPGWGCWVKILSKARHDQGKVKADRRFMMCVEELYGEAKAGEIRNPGAALNMKLMKVFAAS